MLGCEYGRAWKCPRPRLRGSAGSRTSSRSSEGRSVECWGERSFGEGGGHRHRRARLPPRAAAAPHAGCFLRRDLRQESGPRGRSGEAARDRKSTRLNSSHSQISYAVFCLKKKKKQQTRHSEYNTQNTYTERS